MAVNNVSCGRITINAGIAIRSTINLHRHGTGNGNLSNFISVRSRVVINLVNNVGRSARLSGAKVATYTSGCNFIRFLRLILRLARFDISTIETFALRLLMTISTFFSVLFNRLMMNRHVRDALGPVSVNYFVGENIT